MNLQILIDESKILQAIKTADGMAIYRDLLSTTHSREWARIYSKHCSQLETTRAAPASAPTASPVQKSPKSSMDQARQAAGKLARFILAVPADPELKTFSSKGPSGEKRVRAATDIPIPPPWINPMAMPNFNTAPTFSTRRTQSYKDKGKGRAADPIIPQTTDTREFAPTPSMTIASKYPAFTTTNTNAVGTSNTAVPFSLRPGFRPNNIPVSPLVRQHSEISAAVSEESAWPEGDSEGNWFDAKKAKLRGGADSCKKKGKGKRKLW